jgi:hypothetical protein
LNSVVGDIFQYDSLLDVGEFVTHVRYPRGTFASDSLPLEVPLDTATWTIWQYGGDAIVDYAGPITSSSVVEVPEPRIAITPVVFLHAPRRRLRFRQYPTHDH